MIYIITVYDSLNYGSYFQALALSKYLSKYNKVFFIDINHQSTFMQTFTYCIKKCLKLKFADSILNYNKYRKFTKAQRQFKIIKQKNIKINNDDIFIFGSDEIWNISRKKIQKSKEFFGYGINSKNKISYATSINDSTKELFEKNSYIRPLLLDFKNISVRDINSKNVIESITNKDCDIVIDPTLLVMKDFYNQFIVEPKIKNYILIYTYGRMFKEDVINQIKAFAKKNNKKIVSIGKWIEFCDYNIAATPDEFLGYVNDADYVFTDTFHGLMFSIIFNKEFIAFDCDNKKVEDTLKIFNISNRLKKITDNIESILKSKIDYKKVNKIIDNLKIHSEKYLLESINSKENELE